jgi:hypothetical protein
MEISSTVAEFDFNVISASTHTGTMKRLSDIPKEMDKEFQSVGTRLTHIVICNAVFQDLGLTDNSRDDAAGLGWTIAVEV